MDNDFLDKNNKKVSPFSYAQLANRDLSLIYNFDVIMNFNFLSTFFYKMAVDVKVYFLKMKIYLDGRIN